MPKNRSTEPYSARWHHQRLVSLAVLGDVLELEPARQREVELDGGKLPRAADRVDKLHVDLRPVERGFVGHHLDVDFKPFGRILQGILGELPLVGRAVVLAAGAAVPGGELGSVLVESERSAACRWRTAGS